MKRTVFTPALLATALLIAMQAAHAGPQAHVVCSYSHTLGDDAIMMFGMPNQAMWHDFFGNTHTDAFSTRETLRQHEETTCDNKADGSAYWAPSLRLPDGTVVKPAYQKPIIKPRRLMPIPCTRSRPGCRCSPGIITAARPTPISAFYARTEMAIAAKSARCAGYVKLTMPSSLILAFNFRTAGTA